MTGPEHYEEAESLLAFIKDDAYRAGFRLDEQAELSIAARAQAHATLALAAAHQAPTAEILCGTEHTPFDCPLPAGHNGLHAKLVTE